MIFVKKFLVALVMTFSITAMMTYSSSANAAEKLAPQGVIAERIDEAFLHIKTAIGQDESSKVLKGLAKVARQESKELSVGAAEFELDTVKDLIGKGGRHFSYAAKAAKGTGSYKGKTEAEHRALGSQHIDEAIASFENVKAAIE